MKTAVKNMKRKCSLCGKSISVALVKCNECYQEALNEDWLEKKIEKLYGKKCKDYEPHCPCCDAWFLYETILQDNRGEL